MLAGILADSTLDRAVVIDVALEVARARLLARRVCTGCGRTYSVERARGLETWHVMHLDRRLFSATVYPADYGFRPGNPGRGR